MSHLKEREEKVCLNCNTQLIGRYCHVCGQENLEPKETFWHLVTHFVYDVTHFDGKFFSTSKYLLLKPGFLSKEYIKGKRNSYLNPIRMYVFASAIFFLFFLQLFKPDNAITINRKHKNITAAEVQAKLEKTKIEYTVQLGNKYIPEEAKKAIRKKIKKTEDKIALLQKDSTKKNQVLDIDDDDDDNESDTAHYKTMQQYDSAQLALPENKRDGWFIRMVNRRSIEVNEEYGKNEKEIIERLSEKFLHSFPQLMFISLPLFALILQLLYVRRKQYYYVDHVIFSVHLYCGIFVLAFIILALNKISDLPHASWVEYLTIPFWIYIVYYTYKAMRNFYQQRRAKTIFKWLLLNTIAFVVMALLFAVFAFISFLTF